MFKISELAKRDIINVFNGAKLGLVKDVQIDSETGTVHAIVLQGRRRFWFFPAGKDVIVPWTKIKKFGVDAVLVELEMA
jgi:YlmC/YmxH family sporulation protein